MNRKELVKRLKYMIKSVAPNSQTILYGSEAYISQRNFLKWEETLLIRYGMSQDLLS